MFQASFAKMQYYLVIDQEFRYMMDRTFMWNSTVFPFFFFIWDHDRSIRVYNTRTHTHTPALCNVKSVFLLRQRCLPDHVFQLWRLLKGIEDPVPLPVIASHYWDCLRLVDVMTALLESIVSISDIFCCRGLISGVAVCVPCTRQLPTGRSQPLPVIIRRHNSLGSCGKTHATKHNNITFT